MTLPFAPVPDPPSAEVALYVAEAARQDETTLDAEHDRYAWVTVDEAVARCLPEIVSACVTRVDAWLDAQSAG